MALPRKDILAELALRFNQKDMEWLGATYPPEVWYLILSEEVGELAKAMLGGKPEEVADEIYDVLVAGLGFLQEWTGEENTDELSKNP
jgi:NTP pyrophosphatase (non-canonical NTP hydrolase)